jgi:hypothetical protein
MAQEEPEQVVAQLRTYFSGLRPEQGAAVGLAGRRGPVAHDFPIDVVSRRTLSRISRQDKGRK